MGETPGDKTFAGNLWELKPATWETGPKRALAIGQIARYMKDASRGCWTPGSSQTIVGKLPKNLPLFFGGKLISVSYEADPQSNASGLFFYRTQDVEEVPVPVPVPV